MNSGGSDREEDCARSAKSERVNVDMVDSVDEKLANGGLRGEKRGVNKEEEDKRRDGKPVTPLVKEAKAWEKRKRVEKKLGRQSSRFERSMRVLEWLDADCGTRLAKHYEEAGGWRSLPQRRQRQPQAQVPRQQLRLTRSHIALGADNPRAFINQREDSTSRSSDEEEDEKNVLEDSEDFLNDVDADDDDDLVLALRTWQEGHRLSKEQIEEISMKEYVTSSEEDDNGDSSDSEDELVLALKTWKEEQERQEQLQQQQQQHRQHSLSQQAPSLAPVLEDKISSPTYEAFGYFYQDHSSLFHSYSSQKHKDQQQQQHSSVTPYWWGGISSVREGPSSPPILARPPDFERTSSFIPSPRFDPAPTFRGNGATLLGSSGSENALGNIPTFTITTASTLTTAQNHGSSTSINSPLLLPSSPLLSSSSPRIDNSNWNFSRGKPPFSPSLHETALADLKTGAKVSEGGPRGEPGVPSPRTPLVNKTSGFGVFSGWLGSTSSDKQNFSIPDSVTSPKYGEAGKIREIKHRPVCASISTASSDSGIEKSPGYLSPAPRSAGIEKIGEFFRKFHHKLSPSSSTSSSKSTPPQTPGKKLKEQPHKNAPRRLSLSTSSIPSSSLLKPLSPLPVVKLAAVHIRCSATKSDPLAVGNMSNRHLTPWWAGQPIKHPPASEPRTVVAPGQPATGHTAVDVTCSAAAADGVALSAVRSAGHLGRSATDSVAVTSSASSTSSSSAAAAAQADRKGASNIYNPTSSSTTNCASDTKTAHAFLTHSSTCTGKVSPVLSRESQPSTTQTSQAQYLQRHQPLAAKRSTGAISRKNFGGQDPNETSNLLGSRYFSSDKLDALKKSNEALDDCGFGNVSTVGFGSLSGSAHISVSDLLTRTSQQNLRKSPSPEVTTSASVDRDAPGKTRTLLSGGGPNGGSFVDGTSLGDSGAAAAKCMTDTKRRGAQEKEEHDTAKCSEISSSSCEDKGTLSVPSSGHDRSRRGSHGTCNYLFLEQASGRKSPNPPKGRKSPSPIRASLFKAIASSTSSSPSSTESSSKYHHQAVSRVQSLPSPSSPPPHAQQTPKTSPKHVPNLNQNPPDSPTKKVSESPPANYRGRRKFSDTGLTPVPRRLFSEGRRGSLTDERTLVSAKSKLGKLRNQGRKSSDASSVAVLVKMIHNLWGDKDEEMDDITERRESGASLTGSFDDQVLFDKRRKRFSFALSKHKDGVKSKDKASPASEKDQVSKTSGGTDAPDENVLEARGEGSAGGSSGDSKDKNKSSEKWISVSSTSSSPTYAPATAASTENMNYSLSDSFPKEDTAPGAEPPADELPPAGSAVIGSCSGSEFVAPVAQVASRQLVATAVSSAACFVGGMETSESLITRSALAASITNIAGASSTAGFSTKFGKKTATVQFQPIVSWDDNVVGGKISPALRSILKQGTRRHSSFAGFSESSDNLSASQHCPPDNISSVLNKQSKNGLPKSKTSDNYKGILKQTDRAGLNIEQPSSSPGAKKRSKSPSPKSKRNEDNSDYSPDTKSTDNALSLCLKATRSVSPKSKRSRGDGKENTDVADQSFQTTAASFSDPEQFIDSGNCSLDLPTKNVAIQATPRSVGKTSNTGTQTYDLPGVGELKSEHSGWQEEGGWLQRFAAKCMATVGSPNRTGSSGGAGAGLPRAASVRADWLLGNKRMGSSPSSPVASSSDPSERFWVPHEVIARKRAQSLIPTLSKSEDGKLPFQNCQLLLL